MPAYVKSRQHFGVRNPQNWSLHFTRKFNLAIPSRFPGSRIIALLSFSCYGTMDSQDSLLCYSDRIAQVSHLIPSSDLHAAAVSALNMFNMELYWRYTTIYHKNCQPICAIFVKNVSVYITVHRHYPARCFLWVKQSVSHRKPEGWGAKLCRRHNFCASRSVLLRTEWTVTY